MARKQRQNRNQLNGKTEGRRRKKGGFLRILGIVVSLVLVVALGLSVLTFAGGLKRERNSHNLIGLKDMVITDEVTGNGIDIDVRDDGSIKVKGTSTSGDSREVATVTLAAGTYTLSGVKKPDKLNYTLYVEILGQQYHAGTSSATFTLETETDVTVIFQWGKDYKVPLANRVIYPCIVEGKVAGDFYG